MESRNEVVPRNRSPWHRRLGLFLILTCITFVLYNKRNETSDRLPQVKDEPGYPCSKDDPIKRVAIIGQHIVTVL